MHVSLLQMLKWFTLNLKTFSFHFFLYVIRRDGKVNLKVDRLSFRSVLYHFLHHALPYTYKPMQNLVMEPRIIFVRGLPFPEEWS